MQQGLRRELPQGRNSLCFKDYFGKFIIKLFFCFLLLFLILLFQYGNSKINKHFCSKAPRRANFATFGRCGNAHKREIFGHTVTLNKNLHSVAAYPVKKEKVNMMCW